MLDGILQATKHLAAETITGYPNDDQVIGTLVENEFDRNACVGASKNRSKWSLLRIFPVAFRESKIFASTWMTRFAVPSPPARPSSRAAKA